MKNLRNTFFYYTSINKLYIIERKFSCTYITSIICIFKYICIMIYACDYTVLECNVAGFVSNNGHIERVPYVFLPQRGQIIYPHAEIRFEGMSNNEEI